MRFNIQPVDEPHHYYAIAAVIAKPIIDVLSGLPDATVDVSVPEALAESDDWTMPMMVSIYPHADASEGAAAVCDAGTGTINEQANFLLTQLAENMPELHDTPWPM